MRVLLFSTFIFLLNIPFGYWRAHVKKFSISWILAIHVPVLIIIAGRFAFHMPYHLITLPFYIAAFFLGQYSGGKLKTWINQAGC